MENIRPFKKNDAARVAEIHVFGWRAAYRGIVSDEYLFGKMSVVDSVKRWSKPNKDGSELYVYDDGIIKGFLGIGPTRDEDKKGSFELGGIYIEPLMKREGIGTKFVNFCEARAKELGFNEIILWVFEKNEPSRKFYEAMGYKPDGANKIHTNTGAMAVRYLKTI